MEPSTPPEKVRRVETAADGRRPRFVIEKMILENFKSYAGTQEIGPFHKCFTAVVGPNGSGKSNVLDALLFVFGKRAKQIRQKKIGELVHRSAAFPDLEEASVTVHFADVVDEEDGTTTVLKQSAIVLKRTATKSHQSKYYVNGKGATFTEVTALLKGKGVDLENNRFLILQGEVEQIAMMPPKATPGHDEGMLEYLEDIIGTKKYIELIDAKNTELDKVQEERTEKLNRAKLVAKEKQGLEAAKLEAEDFLGKDKEIVRKKAMIAQLQRHKCEAAMQSTVEKKARLTEQLKQEKERVSDAEAKLRELEKAAKAATKEHERALAEVARTKADFAAFQRQDVQLKEDVHHVKAQEKKLKKAIATEDEKAESLAADVERSKEEQARQKEIAEEARARLAVEETKLDGLYAGLKAKTGPLQGKMEAKQKELMPSKTKLQEIESREKVLASESELLAGAEGERDKALARAREDLGNLRGREKEAEKELERVTAALAEQKQRVGAAKKRLAELQKEEQKLSEEVRSTRSRLEEAKAVKSASRSRGAVFEAIMGLKASKAVKGIHGRLGDLGTIDPKYDVAVTTACGALDNIVVQTTDAAQKCVEHLRSGNIGRATFVILDEVSNAEWVKSGMAAPFEPPAGALRLFDLVRASDERYSAALYWAMSDTLVVGDIDAATATAFNGPRRRRVVTLQGELIETQGTMSGGGRNISRGGMKTKAKSSSSSASATATAPSAAAGDSEESIPEMEASLARALSELEKVRTERAGVETEIASLESLSGTTSAKLQMDIQARRAQREEAERLLAEAEKRPALTAEQRKRMAELEGLIAECRRQIAESRESTAALEAEIEEIKAEIMKAGGTALREQKETVAGLSDELAKAERAATKCGVDVAAQGKAAEKSKAAAAKARTDLEGALAKLEELKSEKAKLEEQAVVVMESHEKAKEAAAAKAEEAKKKQAELDSLKEDQSKAAVVQAGLQAELEECAKLLSEKQQATRSFARQLGELSSAWKSIEELLLAGSEDDAPSTAGAAPVAAAAATSAAVPMDVDGQPAEAAKADSTEAKGDDPFRVMSAEELEGLNAEELRVDIGALEEAKNKLSPNMSAIAEYRKKEREHAARMKDLEEATATRDRLRQECDDLRKKRLNEFMAGFEAITLKLKEMYRMITVGGDAELELVDRLNPFSEGVVFSVRPAKKSWKNISNLSGGEKTLSSLALVFALHHFKPTPIYVMDEIDAALDFRNVSIVANYIKERTRGAQFVVVSLRNYMFELADRLVGIFKISDCTSSITISPSQYSASIPPPPPSAAVHS